MPKTDKLGIGNSYISRAQIIVDFLATKDNPKRRREFLRLTSDTQFFRTFIGWVLVPPKYDYYVPEEMLRHPDMQKLRDIYYTGKRYSNNKPSIHIHPIPKDIFGCCTRLNTREFLVNGVPTVRDEEDINRALCFLYFECDDMEREIYIQLLSNTLDLGITAEEIEDVIPDFFTRK